MPRIPSYSLRQLPNSPRQWIFPAHILAGRRIGGYKYISVQSTPSTDGNRIVVDGRSMSASSPDATFEVLGSPYSLLSVTLSPSQNLHTRRGTLVALAGSPDNTISTLRLLNPVRRALIGIPFMYQRITSTEPIHALISTKNPLTTFAILQLDGTTDWKLAQRKALLAWTGTSLNISPAITPRLSLAYWGSSDVTGRGLLALAGQGQIYSVEIAQGESYIVHPSNILAYSTSSRSPLPQPYRFKSSTLKFQIPLRLGNFFPETKFVETLKTSSIYKFFAGAFLRIKIWSRRTIWGDGLFLRFTGPTTLLIQSRAARIGEVLSNKEINEIADAQPGVVGDALYNAGIKTGSVTSTSTKTSDGASGVGNGGKSGGQFKPSSSAADANRTGVEGALPSASPVEQPVQPVKSSMSYATVGGDGKVTFEQKV